MADANGITVNFLERSEELSFVFQQTHNPLSFEIKPTNPDVHIVFSSALEETSVLRQAVIEDAKAVDELLTKSQGLIDNFELYRDQLALMKVDIDQKYAEVHSTFNRVSELETNTAGYLQTAQDTHATLVALSNELDARLSSGISSLNNTTSAGVSQLESTLTTQLVELNFRTVEKRSEIIDLGNVTKNEVESQRQGIVALVDQSISDIKQNSTNELAFFDNKVDEFYRRMEDDSVTVFTKLIDESDDGQYLFVGEAPPGTEPSAASWRIKRFDRSAAPDFALEFAQGTSAFTNVWDDRLSYSYS